MTLAQRAFLGALLGALLVLALHVESRPYLREGVRLFGSSEAINTNSDLLANIDTLGMPDTLKSAALWQLVAAERFQRARPVSDEQIEHLLQVARNAAEVDPDNAYWRQMESVLALRLGLEMEAVEAWLTASQAARWDDYQTSRLVSILRELRAESEHSFGWHYVVARRNRSSATSDLLYTHTIRLLALECSPEERLLRQIATVRNGDLLRNGCKTVEAATNGYRIVRLGALSSDPASLSLRERHKSPAQYERAKGALFAAMREQQLESSIAPLRRAFESNEAWTALVPSSEKARSNLDSSAQRAVVAVTLPGTLLLLGAMGLIPLAIGQLMRRYEPMAKLLESPIAPMLGVTLGVWTWLSSGLIFFAIWITLTLSLFAFVPQRARRHEPAYAGPGFGAFYAAIAILFGVPLIAFMIGITSAGRAIYAPTAGPSVFGPGSTFLLSLAIVALSLVLAATPLLALLYRRQASRLAALALKSFGLALFFGSLALAVIGTPIAMIIDSKIRADMEKMFLNEPTYYLTRQ